MNNHVVIMAGGIGSRFWPMSTPAYPKQFIDVMGVGKSLIQLTVDRFRGICPDENIWIVTSQKYVDIVKEQLPMVSDSHILAEPEPRNTAPCIAYACWKIKAKDKDANIVVTPSDALVIDTEEFRRTIKVALDFTANSNAIVTLGMKPDRPETGYGYIEASMEYANDEIRKAKAFKEKPDIETAKRYFANGNFFWNAGIFVWNVSSIVSELKAYAPQITGIMDELLPCLYTDKETEELNVLFPKCDKISIDYAVMEKSPNIFVLPAEFGWSDLGSWGSLHTLLPQDNNKNACVGKVELHNCTNTIVHTADEKRTIVVGLGNYIVSEKSGQLLICPLSDEQHIKEYSQNK